MLKDSDLNFLRESKLYQSKKDDIEQLIKFLQYPVKRFTVEEICGYHQLQLKIQDELLYLSGMPSYLKPIDLVDAESRIDELCQLCLQMQIFVSHVTASGVERFALEHQAELDLDGQYYVKMDARELTVDNSVCEKPVTLDDTWSSLFGVMCMDQICIISIICLKGLVLTERNSMWIL